MNLKSNERPEERRTIPQFSIDSQFLYERLIKSIPGDFIPYPELNDVTGKNVQHEGRQNLASARRRAISTHALVFKAISGKGLRCLTDTEIANLGIPAMRAVARKARRAAKEISCVQNFSALSKEDQISHNLGLTMLNIVSQVGKKQTTDKLRCQIETTEAKLPFIKSLECCLKTP